MDKEELKRQAFVFIKEQPLGVISTTSQDNTPESATVNYFLDEDWTLYVLTNKNSRKVQNLRINPHIAFVVGTTTVAHTAQMQGTTEIIEENPDFEAIYQKLMDSKRLIKDPMYDVYGKDYVILKIKIDWLRWLYFDQSTGNPIYAVLIP